MQLPRTIQLHCLTSLASALLACDPKLDPCIGNCEAQTDGSSSTTSDDTVSGDLPTTGDAPTTGDLPTTGEPDPTGTDGEGTTSTPDPMSMLGDCDFTDLGPDSHCNDGILQPGDLCFSGAFGTSIPGGTNSSAALVLDADATADVVLAHDDRTLSAVMNGPVSLNPAFVPWAQTFDPPGALSIVGSGDLDGDGVGDIVAQIRDLSNTSVHALFLDGQGGVASTTVLGSFIQPLNSLDLVDWNGDGHLDVVAVDNLVIVTVLRGDGIGGFVPTSGASMSQAFANHALGALDPDSAADDFVFIKGLGLLSVAQHGVQAPLTEFDIEVPGLIPRSVSISDLDQDGLGDIIAVGYNIDYAIPTSELIVGLQRDGFAPARYPVRCGENVFAVGDLDGDGWPDLAAVSDSGELTVRHNDGAGGFERGTNGASSAGMQRLHIADFDGDGVSDIIGVGEQHMSFVNNGV